jgi:hypothetical protein
MGGVRTEEYFHGSGMGCSACGMRFFPLMFSSGLKVETCMRHSHFLGVRDTPDRVAFDANVFRISKYHSCLFWFECFTII